MSFPRYPKYKDSGVEWLGEVPEHWEARPNKALMTLQKREVGSAWSDTELLSLTLRGVVLRDIDSGDGKYPADFSTYQMVEPQDLVFCLFDMDETPRTVGVSRHHGMITAAYEVFRCKEDAVPSFVYYFYLHIDAHKRLRPFYTGLRKTVRTPTFLSIKIPFPPNSEQQVIAAFLDRETTKIDDLIAEQQRLTELLEEKRQAVISHAVTKGLNPDAPMKDSGVEWLGEVPEHWDVCRVKAVSSFTTSGPRGWSERVGEDGSLFVQSGDLNDSMEVDFANCKRVKVGEDAEAARTKLQDGDVVVCVTGAKTGNVAVCTTVPETSYVNQHVCLIRPTAKVLPPFLGMLLKSGYGQTYFSLAQYGLKQGLSLEDVREATVIRPPIDEQRVIIQTLADLSMKSLSLVAEAHSAIALLQERRSALISAAVTGQIDVRNYASEGAAA